MIRKLIFLFILIFNFHLVSHSQTSDLGTWNLLNLKFNYSDKLSFFGEGQIRSLRFYDNFHYYEFKGGFNYKVFKTVQLTLGAGSYQTYKEGGNFITPKNNNELRVWPQLLLSQEVGKIKIEQRYRVELRWTSNGYRNRYRYRFGVTYPFGKDKKGYKPFQLNVNNELFFTDKEPFFERNRLQGSLNYKLSKKTTLQMGYLFQFDYKINDEIGRDFLVLGFYYEFSKKKGEMNATPDLQVD